MSRRTRKFILGPTKEFGLLAFFAFVISVGVYAEPASQQDMPVLHQHNGEITEKSVKFFMGFPGFSGLVSAISRVNSAMQSAAENPMDAWRRKAVREAISAMPAAIVGLADEFKANKLHDGDLPKVQAMLGGFIDVNAADRYKKFLQHPDASLIPEVGPGFPMIRTSTPTITSASIAFAEDAKEGSGTIKNDKSSTAGSIQSSELVDLAKSLAAGEGIASAGGSKAGVSVGFNEDAPEGTSLSSGQFVGLGSSKGAPEGANIGTNSSQRQGVTSTSSQSKEFLEDASRDIAMIEVLMKKEQAECDEENEECEKDDGVFELGVEKEKKEGLRRHRAGEGQKRVLNGDSTSKVSNEQSFKLSPKGKYWRVSTLSLGLLLLPQSASADPFDDLDEDSQDQLIEGERRGFELNRNATPEQLNACIKCLNEKTQVQCSQPGEGCAGVLSQKNQNNQPPNNGGGGGGGNQGSGGGGGGGGGIGGLGGPISQIAQAAAEAAIAAINANRDKYKADQAFRKAVIPAKINADTTKALSENQVAMNADELATMAYLEKSKDRSKMSKFMASLMLFQSESESARQERMDDRKKNLHLEQMQLAFAKQITGAQNALLKYQINSRIYGNQMQAVPASSGQLNVGTPYGGSAALSMNALASRAPATMVGSRTSSYRGPLNAPIGVMPRGRVASLQFGSTRLGVMSPAMRPRSRGYQQLFGAIASSRQRAFVGPVTAGEAMGADVGEEETRSGLLVRGSVPENLIRIMQTSPSTVRSSRAMVSTQKGGVAHRPGPRAQGRATTSKGSSPSGHSSHKR